MYNLSVKVALHIIFIRSMRFLPLITHWERYSLKLRMSLAAKPSSLPGVSRREQSRQAQGGEVQDIEVPTNLSRAWR